MQIKVKTNTEDYVLEVNPSDTVADLKTQIEDKEGIEPIHQLLVLHGAIMEDDCKLSQYDLLNDNSIILYSLLHSMRIFVRNLNGQSVFFTVEPTDTIEDLKKKIQDKEGIPRKEQRLIYGSGLLQDKRPLYSYNIQPYCTLFLTLRLYSCKQCCSPIQRSAISYN